VKERVREIHAKLLRERERQRERERERGREREGERVVWVLLERER